MGMEKELRDRIRKIILESAESMEIDVQQEPQIDLSNVVSSDLVHKKYLKVIFKNSAGQNFCLYIPVSSFSSWYDSSRPSGNVLHKFVNEFVQQPAVEDESLMNEIVDEFGDLIGDEDEPNNSTNSMVGKSKFGTDKAIRQTIPRMKSYDSNLGRGIVTW